MNYRLTTVYPRWRGELVLQRRTADGLTGLSPLARGTLKIRPLALP